MQGHRFVAGGPYDGPFRRISLDLALLSGVTDPLWLTHCAP